jgi:hypothetical protein
MHDRDTMVGDRMQLVEIDTLVEAFNSLLEYYRDVEGLTAPELDLAICCALPRRLDELVNGAGLRKH